MRSNAFPSLVVIPCVKKQAMGQVKIIASLNLAPEIKLERLDLNNFGP